jgi:Cu+-exporting ATPase
MDDPTLRGEGMSCAGYVGKDQRTLEEPPLVDQPSVNLATENARVSLDDPEDVAQVEAPAPSGDPVVTDRLELSVEELNGAAAVARAEPLRAVVTGLSTRRSTSRPRR